MNPRLLVPLAGEKLMVDPVPDSVSENRATIKLRRLVEAGKNLERLVQPAPAEPHEKQARDCCPRCGGYSKPYPVCDDVDCSCHTSSVPTPEPVRPHPFKECDHEVGMCVRYRGRDACHQYVPPRYNYCDLTREAHPMSGEPVACCEHKTPHLCDCPCHTLPPYPGSAEEKLAALVKAGERLGQFVRGEPEGEVPPPKPEALGLMSTSMEAAVNSLHNIRALYTAGGLFVAGPSGA
jgi:hypothetical protein